jgi:endoglucanase
VARSAWTHGAVPVWWDAGSPSANHSTGLLDRNSGAQVYPNLISAIVKSAQ